MPARCEGGEEGVGGGCTRPPPFFSDPLHPALLTLYPASLPSTYVINTPLLPTSVVIGGPCSCGPLTNQRCHSTFSIQLDHPPNVRVSLH